jgi:hypothetical protein
MVQIILMSYDMGPSTGSFKANRSLEVAYWILIVLLSLVPIPALVAAIAGIRTAKYRGWNIAGALLNGVYVLLLFLLVLAMGLTLYTHKRMR